MEPENALKCPGCKDLVEERLFKSHIRKCNRYTGPFKKQSSRLKENGCTPLQIKFLIAELDVCRDLLEDELQGALTHMKGLSRSNMMEEEMNIDYSAMCGDIVECRRCRKKMYSSYDIEQIFYVEECWHTFCKLCVRKYIDEEFVKSGGGLKCLWEPCQKFLMDHQLKQFLGDKFEQLQQKAIISMMNIVECAKCKSQYEFMEGNPRDAPQKNDAGKALTPADKQHYAENRFVCQRPDCKAEQCKKCTVMPYHCGFTCEDYKKHADLKKCRYCDEPLNEKNKSKPQFPALADICNSKDCQALASRACTKILPCGHSCFGCRNEASCLPCLNEECAKGNAGLMDQTSDEYCNICFVEGLGASPCVRSSCGHIFHEKCLQKRLEVRWLTPRIFLNFCLCPLCKKWISLPEDSILTPQLKRNYDLLNRLQKMATDRLKFQQLLKEEKLTNPTSPYYNKPTEYAMAIYAYFECFKCKNPYFGGRKECADAINDARDNNSFKAEELVCPNCCEIPIENCPKHGKDFIEFKCKFCCSTAQWFCWGNTHFCEPCHKRQCNGDYVSKYTKDKLPKCEGVGKCPVGGNHNGNGDEKSLGCAICRNYKENNKGF